MNEGANAFTVTVPLALLPYALAAVSGMSGSTLNNMKPDALKDFKITSGPTAG
jgi:hypothetical protein